MEGATATPSQAATPTQATQGSHSNNEPKIQHSFDGDVKLLNNTFECRMEIRKALSTLQQTLQRLEARNVQVAAEIKLRIDGPNAKEHVYKVSISDASLDVDVFVNQFAPSRSDGAKRSSTSTANGQHGASLSRRLSRDIDDNDDDLSEIRSPKRLRSSISDEQLSSSQPQNTDSLLREALTLLKQPKPPDGTLDFLRSWHAEWVKQGGWLFDAVNKADAAATSTHTTTLRRLTAVQDVLGQSINAASAATLAELANLAKLVPWVEACRKTGADKAQAREEKWRTSSATFHDQSRRDREVAEAGVREELRRQGLLLERIARAQGVELDGEEKGEEGEREPSLGAQLTAELNLEVAKEDVAGRGRVGAGEGAGGVDDDEEG
ncbi:hypothetical protein LTR53_009314 [Teratosphaeriaceae sp. CCFEE 6253]|nr:hypothetical protein LTR53_009314 [Teratosphaeriaceae sp. CCFEE 6253]